LGIGFWILDFGFWILILGLGFWNLYLGTCSLRVFPVNFLCKWALSEITKIPDYEMGTKTEEEDHAD
jgi:hypothetical protein